MSFIEPCLQAQTNYSPYKFTHLAGPSGGLGIADGQNGTARFIFPAGLAADSLGNVYVADYNAHTIRKITPGGLVSTFAGLAMNPGSADGNGTSARFYYPEAVAVDGSNNIYVADQGNYVIRRITPAGVVTTFVGTAGVYGSADGTGGAAQFRGPSGVAVDGNGIVYVSDTYNNTIRKVTPAGVVTTLVGLAGARGYLDATGTVARFWSPYGLATDSSGNIFVADTGNSAVRQITPEGVVTTLAGWGQHPGSTDATGTAAQFDSPQAVAVSASGTVFVADTRNRTIRAIAAGGVVTTFAGTAGTYGTADDTGSAARFGGQDAGANGITGGPFGIAIDFAGYIYVGDSYSQTIRKVTPDAAVTTLAGSAAYPGSADGSGTNAGFNLPYGVAVDFAGGIWVADTLNQTIRKITSAGMVSTLAGLAGNPGAADGTNADARFNTPSAVTADSAGNIFVADSGNRTVRKITSAGVVTTFAGLAGSNGSADGTNSDARFNQPTGITSDGANVLYVTDFQANTIRKITPDGVVTTLAGVAGSPGSADGTNNTARFNQPAEIAADASGTLYVADYGNFTVRRITPAGVVTTLAGLAGSLGNVDGMGSSARFNRPEGIAVDASGTIFVADNAGHTLRRITPDGLVSTLAGIPGLRGSDDGAGAHAHFNYPRSIAVDGAGNIYLADSQNHSIRKGIPVPALTNPSWAGPGQFQFHINTIPGTNYAIQSSTSLTDWISIAIVPGVGGIMSFVDSNAAAPRVFYRALLQ